MHAKITHTPSNAVYAYGQIEAAVGAAVGVDPDGQKGWLRARITHLRKLGLGRAGSGRRGGLPLAYSREDADKWLVSLEIQACGVDPVTAAAFIKARWDPPKSRDASKAVDRGEASISELVEVARKSQRRDADVVMTVQTNQFVSRDRLPDVGCFVGSKKGLESFYYWLGQGPHRACAFNLSARLRALDVALESALDRVAAKDDAALEAEAG